MVKSKIFYVICYRFIANNFIFHTHMRVLRICVSCVMGATPMFMLKFLILCSSLVSNPTNT